MNISRKMRIAMIAAWVVVATIVGVVLGGSNGIALALVFLASSTASYFVLHQVRKLRSKQEHKTITATSNKGVNEQAQDAIVDSVNEESSREYLLKIALLEQAGGEYATQLKDLTTKRNTLLVEATDMKEDADRITTWQKRGDYANRIKRIDDDIERLYVELADALTNQHARAIRLLAKLNGYRTRIGTIDNDAVNTEGIHAQFDPLFAEVQTLANGSDTNPRLLTRVTECETQTSQVGESLQNLEREITLLTHGPSEVHDRIVASRALLGTVTSAIKRCVQQYGSDAVAPITGSDDTAKQKLIAAENELANLSQPVDLTRPHEAWRNDLGHIITAKTYADTAAALIDSIGEFERSLATAKAEAPSEIEDATEAICNAQRFIDEHLSDISNETAAGLRPAYDILEDAKALLKHRQPDYLKAVKLAHDAASSAALIQGTAEEEYREAVRFRQDLSRKLNACKAALAGIKAEYNQRQGIYSEGIRRDIHAAETTLRAFDEVPATLKMERAQALQTKLASLRDMMEREYQQANL